MCALAFLCGICHMLQISVYVCRKFQPSIAYFCTFTEGTDYTAITGTVTLTPTDAQRCVTIMIEDDSVLEETESLTVSLSPTGVTESVQLSQQTTTIVITDDDRKKLKIHV